MKIRVNNLGPIIDGEVSVGNFNVFIGPNGTGKSYLAKLIYGFFSSRLRSDYIRIGLHSPDRLQHLMFETSPSTIDEVRKLITELDVESALRIQKRVFASYCVFYKGNIHNFFSDKNETFNEFNFESYEIRDLDSEDIELIKGYLTSRLDNDELNNVDAQKALRRVISSLADLCISVAVSGNPFSRAFYLPASRSNILLLHRLIYTARLSRPTFTEKGVETIDSDKVWLDTPTEDFILSLLDINNSFRIQSLIPDNLKSVEKFFEANFLKGGKFKVRPSKTELPEFSYKLSSTKKELDLHLASSMVMETSPLFLYIKHLCHETDFLIIDEPESHLHPEAQMALIETLALLASKGIKILVVTHSPYILSCINNHLKLSKILEFSEKAKSNDISKQMSAIRKDKTLRTPINHRSCTAYSFSTEGHIESAFNAERGLINERELSDTFKRINSLYERLRDVEWDLKDAND